MRIGKQLRSVAALGALVGGSLLILPNCKTAEDLAAGCNGLDIKANKFDASVDAFNKAAGELETAAVALENKWLSVCMELDTELKLDTSGVNSADPIDKQVNVACGLLNARIASALAKGVTVTLDVAYSCDADLSIQGNCEANCYAAASCDVAAKCEPGKLVVDCNGTCDAECDITAPSVTCSGVCQGTCEADITATCTGQCAGSCDAPTWEGTCDAGCTASFSGTCGGVCNGTCDGTATTGGSDGNCAGKCEGSCAAKASGTCKAQCTGNYSGGTCSGKCTGKCSTTGGASCSGTCHGTCQVTGGAKCTGECHGHCSAEVAPPRCTGHLDCTVDANCQASCQAQASAKVTCGGHANWVVEGDLALYNALVKYADDIGAAFNQTIALKDPIGNVLAKAGDAIKAAGDLTASGSACMVTALSASVHAQASISVSVNASASVQGKGSASS